VGRLGPRRHDRDEDDEPAVLVLAIFDFADQRPPSRPSGARPRPTARRWGAISRWAPENSAPRQTRRRPPATTQARRAGRRHSITADPSWPLSSSTSFGSRREDTGPRRLAAVRRGRSIRATPNQFIISTGGGAGCGRRCRPIGRADTGAGANWCSALLSPTATGLNLERAIKWEPSAGGAGMQISGGPPARCGGRAIVLATAKEKWNQMKYCHCATPAVGRPRSWPVSVVRVCDSIRRDWE
jgi:hypothetical protein